MSERISEEVVLQLGLQTPFSVGQIEKGFLMLEQKAEGLKQLHSALGVIIQEQGRVTVVTMANTSSV